MTPMNHTRQLFKSMDKYPEGYTHFPGEKLELLKKAFSEAQKFVMPEGGLVLEADHAKAMLHDPALINLPYPQIVVEYVKPIDREKIPVDKREFILANGGSLEGRSKEFIYAMDTGHEIAIYSAWSTTAFSIPDAWILTDPLVTSKSSVANSCADKASKVQWENWDTLHWENHPHREDRDEYLEVVTESAGWNIGVLCNLIAALSCTNVTAPVTHTPAKSNPKAAYPFHSYREVLLGGVPASVIRNGQGGGSSRSPREHMRRGHFRRLPTGKSAWVRNHMVNAGVGGGVDKTYRMRGEA